MCLHGVKTIKCKIAKEDIICYKVLLYSSGSYCTPFRKTTVNPNSGESFSANGVVSIQPETYWFEPSYCVAGGFIHTFKSPTDAESFANMQRLHVSLFTEIATFPMFECIIPKGTKYYIGKDDEGRDGYASKEIIFKEEIN